MPTSILAVWVYLDTVAGMYCPDRFLCIENSNVPLSSRICPARYLAHSTAWLAIVQILASFNIVPKQDEKGRDILAPPEFMGRLLM